MTNGLRMLLMLVVTTCGSGCLRQPPLSTEYGRSSGIGLTSVNGTATLVRLFRESGKRVSVSRRLGDLVSAADVVVWAPNSYELPRRTVTRYFDAWLAEKPGRRLIYIAKNYDGAVEYWRAMANRNSDDVSVQREFARALTNAEIESSANSESESCDWFRLDRVPRVAKTVNRGRWAALLGELPASDDSTTMAGAFLVAQDADVSIEDDSLLDGSSSEEVRSDRLRVLLADDEEILAAEYHRNHWRNSHALLFSTGDWLLNLPLVSPSAQVVAEQVLMECGAARRVVFLESGIDGPQISDGKSRHHALEAFTVRPFNSILLHLTVLGMLLCCAVFPIFGRPRPLKESGSSDFRRHVIALGELLARTRDTEYARGCRDHYWTKVRRESGISNADRAGNATATSEGSEGNPFATPDDSSLKSKVARATLVNVADRMLGDSDEPSDVDDTDGAGDSAKTGDAATKLGNDVGTD